jgi:hypothetical protein
MAIYRLTASADTTITDGFKIDNIERAVYSNIGAADSLELYSIYINETDSQKSRILIKFPNEKIAELRNNGQLPLAGNVKFYLKLFNVEHPYTVPQEIDVEAYPVSGAWQEGFGVDLDNYNDLGIFNNSGSGANWVYRTINSGSQVTWATMGGDYFTAYQSQAKITDSEGNLELDVTNAVEDQLSNTIANDGFIIKLTAQEESASLNKNYYTKRFSARGTQYFYSKPILEARWASYVDDNRDDFYYVSPNVETAENSGSIYFYNTINGKLKNLPNDTIPQVKILSGSTVLLSGSSTKIANGSYKFMFALTGSGDAEVNDVWYSGSSVFYTGSVYMTNRIISQDKFDEKYIFAITNLKKQYSHNEEAFCRIYSRKLDWSPTIYSVSSKEIENIAHNNLYYKIFRLEDNLTVVDYGFPPESHTACSIDSSGNYFNFQVSILEPGYTYGIKLALFKDGQIIEAKDLYKFKVVYNEQ